MPRLLLTLAVMGACALPGCGPARPYDGPPRISLTGNVTFNGEPVDKGTISFIPTDDASRVSGGEIVQGRYTVPEEKGANAGAYRVEIHWPKPTGKKYKDPDTLETFSEHEESIPKKFNTQSELTAQVSETKNEFDFELKQ